MLFNSQQFLLFFPLVTLIYFLLPHKFRWIHLLLASCVFYMAFIPTYIFILFFTIIIDYIAGITIENAIGRKRKWFLIMSIIANVGVLAVFKYYNFFIENVNGLFHLAGITTNSIPLLNIILPVGLSFHTFQAMSYTIEVYRGNQKAEKHFGIYALYVMFYPQLVAGPIERPQNLLHQFREKHHFDSQNLLDGLRLMLWGFFKKVVIADRVAIYVNNVYNAPGDYYYSNLIIATFLFGIQIYCDFSGYSDIAIGAARTMGFKLMTNFNRPYFSTNIQEFWKRWHISLSTWFRDYVYIPLGGNRVGVKRLYLNIVIVFLLSGFWHGANWTFVAWGALHAVFIISYSLYKRYFKYILPKSLLFNFLSGLLTFTLVCFAWIFFRANSLSDAFLIVKHICTFSKGFHDVNLHQFTAPGLNNFINNNTQSKFISIVMIAIMLYWETRLRVDLFDLNNKLRRDIAFCSIILSLIIMFGMFNNNNFIYFQF